MSRAAPLPELVAHRGYALRFPENTLAALRGAFEAGARQVEVDVQLSADGTPFLFHDRSLRRVCGLDGDFSDLADREVAALSAAERGRFGERYADERVPRLAAFAELLAAQPGAHAFVEVKPHAVERFGAERALEAVLAALEPARGRCALISFSVELLKLARARTELELGLILERWSQRGAPEARELAAEYCFCDVDKLPPDGRIAMQGARVAVYEVVDPAFAVDLGRRGADFVETFAIREMLAAFESWRTVD